MPISDGKPHFVPPRDEGVPVVSTVVPCFNNEPIIEDTVGRLERVLAESGRPFEMLFWDDGSTDGTRKVLSALAERHPRLGFGWHSPNIGAGRAMRELYRRTRGEIVLQMDCDLATPPETFIPVARRALTGADLVLVTRYGSVRAVYPWRRRVVSRLKTALYRLLFDMPVSDSCSGFYGFRGDAIRGLPLTSDGFVVQLEMILCARDLGWQIEELPMEWRHQTLSGEVRIIHEGTRTLRGLLRLALNRRRRTAR